jgi:hypothetical protein
MNKPRINCEHNLVWYIKIGDKKYICKRCGQDITHLIKKKHTKPFFTPSEIKKFHKQHNKLNNKIIKLWK